MLPEVKYFKEMRQQASISHPRLVTTNLVTAAEFASAALEAEVEILQYDVSDAEDRAADALSEYDATIRRYNPDHWMEE